MKTKETSILLPQMKFFARHGVDPQEQTVGAYFIVNLEIAVDFTHAMHTDELDGTINYASLHHLVKQKMEIPSKLLEHVAGRITEHLFQEFPSIERIKLEVYKENPPMGADIPAAGVRICAER